MKRKVLLFILLTAATLWAATVKTSYRALATAMTTTNLQSLATTSNLAWESALVDNNVNQDIDEIAHVIVKSNASGVSATGTVIVYVYGCAGGTTTCDDTAVGTEGTITLSNPPNLIRAATCNVVANSTVYNCPSFSVANQFGGTLPPRWGISIVNNSGAALFGSGSSVTYDSVQIVSQ